MKTLALIDVAGIFRAQWSISEGQEISTAYTQTLKRVHEIRALYDYAAVCLDSPPYRRKQISADYKAQRDKPSEALITQYRRVKQRLADDGLPVFAAEGYEADDVIATLVAQAVALPEDKRLTVAVISTDKDLMQLVSDAHSVICCNWSTGARFDEAAVTEEFRVAPSGIRDLLALAGDSSDNIAGVKGVGRITAAQVVNSGPGLDGALAGEFIKGITPRIAHAIAEAREAVLLARKLITLEYDAPVSLEEVFVKREPKPQPAPEPAPRAKPVVSAAQIVSRSEMPSASAGVTRPDGDWGMGVPVDLIVARVDKIREVQAKIMKEGHHYGVVPGTSSKPSLFKPGAELLTLTFQLDPQFTLTEQREGDHLETLVTCTLYHAPTGTRVGSNVGSCSTRESKYAYRQGERMCPHCKKPAIIKGKQEYGGGWVCFTRKGGCNAKFHDNDPAITRQSVERTNNPDLADSWNTVRKMACKRAHVAAILLVTCASEIFTQDVEDSAEQYDEYESQPRPAQRQRGAA